MSEKERFCPKCKNSIEIVSNEPKVPAVYKEKGSTIKIESGHYYCSYCDIEWLLYRGKGFIKLDGACDRPQETEDDYSEESEP